MRNTVYLSIKFLLLTSLVILGACQKEKNNSPSNNCPLNIFTIAGYYSFTSLKYKQTSTSAEIDWMQFLAPCERDDEVFLSVNGTYTYTDKGLVCDPDGNEGGTWQLKGNTLTSDGLINGTIEKFDCKTLVFYVLDINVPGDRMTLVLTRL
jgi:hypothetical protein